MAQYLDLLFSDYVPDRGGAPWAENPGYLVDAVNVRFTPNGYRSTYLDAAATTSTTAVGATPIAARAFADVTNPRHYVGTATKIYESSDSGVTWNDNAGAAYTAADWDFAMFNTTVVAVDGVDVPQAKDLDAAVGNNFAALGGTPPTAALVARIRDSLVLSDLLVLQWSSIGDPTDWPTPGSATALARQAGSYTPSKEFGIVTRIVGGEKFGLIFQDRIHLRRVRSRIRHRLSTLDDRHRGLDVFPELDRRLPHGRVSDSVAIAWQDRRRADQSATGSSS
jgi:hypothetical protein